MTPPRAWQLSVLGDARLTAPDGRPVRCEGRSLALLTYLALEGPVPRRRLASLLWPDRPEAAGRNNLVQLLRRMSGAHGEDLVLAGEKLALAPDLRTDVQDLLVGTVGDVPEGTLLQGVSFEEAPDLTEWLAVQRERLDQRRAGLLARRSRDLEAAGAYGPAAQAAERALTFDRLSEEAYRRAMRLHYLGGDSRQALVLYERLQDALRAQLRLEPMQETRDLARLIRRGEQLPITPSPAAPRPLPEPTVLAGREREWAAMEAAWQAGRFIIVSGEPGMGKSRLAQEFARSKGRVLALEGRPGDHLVPYTATARNLRRALALTHVPLPEWVRRSLSWLLPELAMPGEAPSPGADARLHEAIQHVFLIGLSQVDVCLFDDLQYVDEASIEAGFVLIDAVFPLGRPGGLPHFVAVHRRDELPRFTQEVFGGMVRAGQASSIEVGPLGEEAVKELLAGLQVAIGPERAAELTAATGGNPLFLLESVRAWLDEGPCGEGGPKLPRRVGALIARRLTRLSKMALHVARAGAVLQRDFSPELIAEVLSAPLLDVVAAWEELEAAQVVRGERFLHDLVYEAVLAEMSPTVRRLLQRSAARVLAAQGGSPAAVAQLFLDAGQDSEAAPWLLRAGEAAQAALRLREAASLFDRAARILHAQGEAAGAFGVWVRGAQALAPLGDSEARQHAINTVLERAELPLETAQAWQLQAELFAACNEGARAEVAARRGLAELEGQDAPELHANLLADLGTAYWTLGRMTDAVSALREAVRRLEPLGDTAALASNLSSLAVVLDHQDRHREAEGHHRRACELLERLGDTANLLVALRNHAVCLGDLGRVRDSLPLLRRALDLEGGSEGLWNSPIGHALVALAHADLGEYDLALAHYGRARAVEQDPSGWLHAYYGACEGEVWLTLGEWDRAEALLGRARDVTGMPDTYRLRVLVALGRLALARGEDAQGVFASAGALLGPESRPMSRVRLLLARGEAAVPDEAVVLAHEALALARVHELGGYELTAEVCLARALLHLGRAREAGRHAERVAVRLNEVEAADMTRGEVLLTLHGVRRALGHPDAEGALREAERWVRGIAEGHVPPGARLHFLSRNAVNRAILTLASPGGADEFPAAPQSNPA
ncbi:ATP-binding protein [Deinococcus apachensis]|uniref:ATP-binding protein n=1 Tax=Deinococcus apachensis TaxID=309886 RepID=UPI0012FAC4E6|nr:AAA family ATPase [Deinococcus apachensis]